jgi:ribosomal protein S18 acetylase RimI-like enzyme
MRFEADHGCIEYGTQSDPSFDADGYESNGPSYIMIYFVYVEKEYRRQGIARKMLSALLDTLHGQTVKLAVLPKEVSIAQDALVSFYESIGFSASSVQGSAAVVMEMKA